MKRGFTFVAGMLMGAALFSGGTAYAAGLMAEPSSQKIGRASCRERV